MPPDLLLYAEKLADATLHRAEARYGLKLNWDSLKTTIFEYGFTEQKVVKDMKAQGEAGQIWLYIDPETQKPGIWADSSFTEIEVNREKYAVAMRSLIKPVAENRWSIDKQLEFNQQTAEFQRLEQQFFAKHNKLISEVSRLIRDLRQERRQRIKDKTSTS